MSLTNDVRTLRKAAGWTQAELAERCDVSRQTIIAIERGKYEPSLSLAFVLARIFDKPIEHIFTEAEE
ncbi:helix-turn-helix transcriptional regulator [Thalassobius sp. Cn5-15]|uniref:helix-turn-helix transcriptional regulator n=1 Tax=Thalassobius sp. Cn5-15 TaxID=2917763 RepID=UPI001EF172DE|nr:helix-turn-helix transcriptional regulator [Thalassobius sp. Cn5-15]MCG7495111.1 helix-turn-helix transcriptional regulator [Thalassobius sp. Cn5-15]